MRRSRSRFVDAERFCRLYPVRSTADPSRSAAERTGLDSSPIGRGWGDGCRLVPARSIVIIRPMRSRSPCRRANCSSDVVDASSLTGIQIGDMLSRRIQCIYNVFGIGVPPPNIRRSRRFQNPIAPIDVNSDRDVVIRCELRQFIEHCIHCLERDHVNSAFSHPGRRRGFHSVWPCGRGQWHVA